MASEQSDTVVDAGSASISRDAKLRGTSNAKLAGGSPVITMGEDPEYVWKTLRRWKWVRHGTISGRWIQQRDYQRVRVPIERSRARDHTIVPSKQKKRNIDYWISLDPDFRMNSSSR